MIDSKQEIREASDLLWEAFGDTERGSIVAWSSIETKMGRSRYDMGGWTIINKLRRRLIKEREVVTIAKEGIGLWFLTHQEAAQHVPQRRQKRAYRQVNRGLKEMATVDGARLSDHQRKVLTMQRSNMRNQRLEIGRSRRELAKGIKRSETHPVRCK